MWMCFEGLKNKYVFILSLKKKSRIYNNRLIYVTDPSQKCEIGKKTKGNNAIFTFSNGELI